MILSRVAIVHNDEGDWKGLYVDGILVYEGHSISSTILLDKINVEYEAYYDVSLEDGAGLPSTLKELIELVSEQDDRPYFEA